MATGVKSAPPAPPHRSPSAKRTPTEAPPHQMSAWRASLIILLAFVMVGIIPLGIVAEATGHLGFPKLTLPVSNPFATNAPTPTDVPDLNLPRDAWVAQSVDVLPHPGQGTALATLAPAFPVRLLQHQRAGATVWSRIEWGGPVKGTGGAGWVPDASLVSYGHTSAILGDLGALAPSLRQAVASSRQQFSGVVYIPSQKRLYSAGGMDSSFALGSGFRPMLLSALYAGAEAQNAGVSLTDALAISQGNATAVPAIYQRLGSAAGLSLYLNSRGIRGFQTSPTWGACQATPRAMIVYYAQLAGSLHPTKDRASIMSMLSLADAATTSTMAASWARTAGNLLVVGSAQTDSTWTVSVAGILNPPNGPQLIVVAVVAGQPSTAAALKTLTTYYTQLTTLFGG